jgi:hypothetical protein
MLSSSGVGNGARGRGIVRRRGGHGGRGIGCKSWWSWRCFGGPVTSMSRIALHGEIILPMGDLGHVANVVI